MFEGGNLYDGSFLSLVSKEASTKDCSFEGLKSGIVIEV